MTQAYGQQTPGWLESAVIAATSRLPDNWLGLRLAIGLRRIVTMRIADDDGLDVVRWGLRMRLHPRRNGCEKNALFTPQMYEAPERAELFKQVDEVRAAGRTFVFVDVGANVGLFSFLVASHAGASAQILAIEPEPENLRRLRFNIAANPDVPIRVIPVALGDKRELVTLEVNSRDRGGTRTRALRPGHSQDADHSRDDAAGVVECRTLLDVLDEERIAGIDALKIDAEGAEDAILVPFFHAAPETLWPRLIIIENAPQSWRTDLLSLLQERGYTLARRTKLNIILRRRLG
ncbi:MAG: FkbM family methyltransferase [Xanthobacteraceae bacterium]